MSNLASPSQMTSGKLCLATDRAVKSAEDVPFNLKFLKFNIESVRIDEGQVIYFLQTQAVEGILVKRVANGTIEVDITIDTSALTVAVQVYFDAPIIGHILLGQGMGALMFNSGIKIDFNVTPETLATGYAGVKLEWNSELVLSWDYTSLGVQKKGSFSFRLDPINF
ncbi:hypothetical protein DEU56DRAFT_81786 [Suillus clintonianus]|uniref:uncharacterized protein n=1 Tax=Suillus clintonianus TaxID=1904413 RepID=UPI001B87E497|nr:uncharacterized protein DEU56DRAFT_81786 [Suillus clintonianus]KAG2148821.1 hypothetical protein DEU56DRAFT_81786 [Suillus clintonianus]